MVALVQFGPQQVPGLGASNAPVSIFDAAGINPVFVHLDPQANQLVPTVWSGPNGEVKFAAAAGTYTLKSDLGSAVVVVDGSVPVPVVPFGTGDVLQVQVSAKAPPSPANPWQIPTATPAYTQQDGASLRPTPGGPGIFTVDRAGKYALRLQVDIAAGGIVAADLDLTSDMSATDRGHLRVDGVVGSDSGTFALSVGDVLTLSVRVDGAAANGQVLVTVRAERLS